MTRGRNTIASVTRLGSGSKIAIIMMRKPYRYFRFPVKDLVFRMPALTSKTTNVERVNIKPLARRANPTNEKNSLKAYVGGRSSKSENMKIVCILKGTMYKYPR